MKRIIKFQRRIALFGLFMFCVFLLEAQIKVSNGTQVIISPASTITIENDLDNGGQFIISADASQQGSLILKGASTGYIKYQSYLPNGGDKWHVISSPLKEVHIYPFAYYNQIASRSNPGTERTEYAITDYLEGIDDWNYTYATDDIGFFVTGKGYSMLRTSAGSLEYTGTVNTTDLNGIIIARSGNGWNLLGNPYTSAINATVSAHATNNLITANTDNFDPSFAALYMWDATANAGSGAYVTINNAGTGSLVQNYIQAGQGFFVRSKTGGGTFDITKAMQTHQVTVPLKSGKIAWPSIRLFAESSSKSSSTLIAFNNNMTTGLDVTYDAGMFKADKDFALYSRLVEDNGVDFAIQALPVNQLDELVIPLGIDVPGGTEITFSAETVNLPANAAVYLEDKAAGAVTRLDKMDAEYTVTITEQTKGAGNFYLHTGSATTTVNEIENKLQPYRIVANNNERRINVFTKLEYPGQARVYDVMGRLHGIIDLQKNAENRIYINGKSGVYMVLITSKESRWSGKVFLN